MPANYLPQTVIVESLIKLIEQALPNLADESIKQGFVNILKEFETISVPTAIYIEEAHFAAKARNITIDSVQARAIIEAAAVDINEHYASKAIEYYVDEYVSQAGLKTQ